MRTVHGSRNLVSLYRKFSNYRHNSLAAVTLQEIHWVYWAYIPVNKLFVHSVTPSSSVGITSVSRGSISGVSIFGDFLFVRGFFVGSWAGSEKESFFNASAFFDSRNSVFVTNNRYVSCCKNPGRWEEQYGMCFVAVMWYENPAGKEQFEQTS